MFGGKNFWVGVDGRGVSTGVFRVFVLATRPVEENNVSNWTQIIILMYNGGDV